MIKEIKIDDIPGRKIIRDTIIPQIDEFQKSDWPACEVEIGKYKSVDSAKAAWNKAVTACHYAIDVITRQGRLFLIKR